MGADLSYGIYSWLCSTFTEKPITGNNLTTNSRYWSDLLCLWKDESSFLGIFFRFQLIKFDDNPIATDGAILKSHIVAKCGFTTHVSFFNEVTQ
jgi:hypothetical protein